MAHRITAGRCILVCHRLLCKLGTPYRDFSIAYRGFKLEKECKVHLGEVDRPGVDSGLIDACLGSNGNGDDSGGDGCPGTGRLLRYRLFGWLGRRDHRLAVVGPVDHCGLLGD